MYFRIGYLREKLKAKRIIIDPTSIIKNPVQGMGSTVYVINSNVGRLVIHTGHVGREENRQKTWEKVEVVGQLLQNFSRIPSSLVFLSTILGKKYYIVQGMLPGRGPGRRIEKKAVFDVWNVWSRSLGKNIEKIIAHIHQIPINGGGWIVKRNDKPVGKYKSWESFLDRELPIWLRSIEKQEKSSLLTAKLNRYYQQIRPRLVTKKSFLVHGDLTSPSNILILGNKVSGVVDWEFALAGDPAWEFCFNNRYRLDTYFLERKFSLKQREVFAQRSKLYEPLFIAWVLSMLTNTDSSYKSYRRRLESLGF